MWWKSAACWVHGGRGRRGKSLRQFWRINRRAVGPGHKVLRGGSWNNKANNVRSANRNRNNPDNRNNNRGFRCASRSLCLARGRMSHVYARTTRPQENSSPRSRFVPRRDGPNTLRRLPRAVTPVGEPRGRAPKINIGDALLSSFSLHPSRGGCHGLLYLL
jgi:hypothetical protein